MKIPSWAIFAIGKSSLADRAGPTAAETIYFRQISEAHPVMPVQRAFLHRERLVQSGNSKFRFIEENPAIPVAAVWLLPIPSQDRERISGEFPSMIQGPPECRGCLEHFFDFFDVTFDANAAGLRAQILGESNVRGVFHERRHSPFLGRENVSGRAAKSDPYRLRHQPSSFAFDAHRTDAHGDF